jgi:hypothetical protein
MACPVCFGDSNEPLAVATNYGIWFMLGIVAVMLSAFATFFIHLMRRARLAAPQPSPVDGASYIRGHEGTA